MAKAVTRARIKPYGVKRVVRTVPKKVVKNAA